MVKECLSGLETEGQDISNKGGFHEKTYGVRPIVDFIFSVFFFKRG
jgi:hypothetical protein